MPLDRLGKGRRYLFMGYQAGKMKNMGGQGHLNSHVFC